ncbi:MAG: radical SAM protein [Syntrophobacteraceae bacterium]
MKLFIIQPAHSMGRSNLKPYKTSKRNLVGLSLPYLAALTPKEWDIELIDQQLMDIDFNAPVDLVAITTWTINSQLAYEISGRFRARGVPVIMGGPHTFFFAEEAAQHCDAVGIGEGEKIWLNMLEDAASGRLRKFYRAEKPLELTDMPFPRHDLLDFKQYTPFKAFAVQTSRGCPFRCDFCSERFYLGQEYRYRPVGDVIAELKYAKIRNVFFADSTFAGKKSHTMELMEALIPLKVRWSALWSSNLCRDQRFLDCAKRSGLLHVNIGLETVDRETLAGMNKKINRVAFYKEIINNLRKRGISFSFNFVFGYDTERENICDLTLAFLRDNKVPAAYFNILTPHVGTPLYDRMRSAGRLIDPNDIGRWPGLICYFKPKNCTPKELEEKVKRMYREFYSLKSMVGRLGLPMSLADFTSWTINFSQRRMFQSDSENFDNY